MDKNIGQNINQNITQSNCLIKLLLDTKTKPNLSKYTLEQLTQMYLEFIEIENKNNINKLYLEKEYSQKTIDLLNSIWNDTEILENKKNKKNQNLMFLNESDDVKKKFLINYIYDVWKKIPIIDGSGDVVDCMICLTHATNNDHICFQCEHITHSTCFFNYLFTNLKNNTNHSYNNYKNLLKLFRCPNCRNCLTSTIGDEYMKEFENGGDDNNDDDNDDQNWDEEVENEEDENEDENEDEDLDDWDDNYSNIEQQYGDEFNNFIFHEYDLFTNNIENQILNDFFRTTNDSNILNNRINFIINSNMSKDDTSDDISDVDSVLD